MKIDCSDDTSLESIKCLLLDVSQARSVEDVQALIVERLDRMEPVALARIWVKAPGDICDTCHLRAECPDQTECLHLVASAGSSLDGKEDWSSLDGFFRRFPMGVRKVGQIAASGEPVEVSLLSPDASWIAHPEWAERERIRGVGGQPLVFQGEVIGVLIVFTREPMTTDFLLWLRMLADHAAAAIVHQRAFDEISQLKKQLELENEYLREVDARAFGDIVGESNALAGILRQIELVAPTDASVLILGESGTGKELVAREIHRRSTRAARPLIRVNCASIPKDLYESEFFGHVKGAFTGAVQDRAGRFELADQGTLFLDEVGEIPLELQAKLLRVLQEGTYERVGDESVRRADVRIIAATNRDLRDGQNFRQDLYYRLNVFPIEVPPLREREEDIPPLAMHFLDDAAARFHMPRPRLTQAQILKLQRYAWPGNARELRNVVERALITSAGRMLRFDLPEDRAAPPLPVRHGEVVPDAEMRQRERANLVAALEQTGGKVSGRGGAAELLGIPATTLASRMKKLGITRPVAR